MSELDEIRKNIDTIDKQLVALYELRLEAVNSVAEYKKTNHVPVLAQNRENVVLENAEKNVADKKYAKAARDFMQIIMDISKDYQRISVDENLACNYKKNDFDKSAKVGYFGELGSNTWQAMTQMFDCEGESYNSFEKIFVAINENKITYGIIPIENSSTGAIVDAYDLLKKYNFYIIAEKWMRIQHQLFGIEGACLCDIQTVYSHTQALAQCGQFFEGKNIQLVPYKSTSESAKFVANLQDKSCGAIASDGAGKLLGLKKLQSNIHDDEENFTRFIVVSKTLSNVVANKISIVFNLKNQAGTLYNALRFFSKLGINLIKIESRPEKNNPCHYYFFVDIDGNVEDKNIQIALDYVKQNSTYFKFLGEYVKGEIL